MLAAVAYRIVGQYQVHRFRLPAREEMVAVGKGVALLSLLVMATTFYTHDQYESRRGTMALFTLLTAGGTLITHRADVGGNPQVAAPRLQLPARP